MSLDRIYDKVSAELGIPKDVVRSAYLHSWKFIKEKISELPLKEDLTEDEFNELRRNFNQPSLGKMYIDYQKYLNLRKRYEIIKEIKLRLNEVEESETNVHFDCDDDGQIL